MRECLNHMKVIQKKRRLPSLSAHSSPASRSWTKNNFLADNRLVNANFEIGHYENTARIRCASRRCGSRAEVKRAGLRPARILYFTHSAGYRHDVIPTSQDVLQRIGATADLQITMAEDVAVFTTENLLRYGGIMFFDDR